jgi:DNA replication and repair protein RecF
VSLDGARRLWVERIALTDFRSYPHVALDAGPEPVVLVGANGAGKTNILEAVSLLSAGQGLRRAPYGELARRDGKGGWAIAARVHGTSGPLDIGTGVAPPQPLAGGRASTSRLVRVDGEPRSGTGCLADLVEMVWLIPAMDGLFTGPAGERRRFLDRLILCFDPAYRTIAGRFERAMQSRNRLLANGVRDAAELGGFEIMMAESGVAIAAARAEAASPFPWATIALEGPLEAELATLPAVEVEERYVSALARGRERDRAAGRTLDGPHRSDLVVAHGPKQMPASVCSTGEQKALLLGLVLAHAELVAARTGGMAPILLLDEITAHLDETRRAALFDEIVRLKCQAWMTGTDASAFSAMTVHARLYRFEDGGVRAG